MVFFWNKAADKDGKKDDKKDDSKDQDNTAGPSTRETMRSSTRDAPPPYTPAPAPPTPALNDDDDAQARLSLHPSISPTAGLLVKLTPPIQPANGLAESGGHIGCDIVLVIDVSGSMGSSAPVPGDGNEDFGLSVLDLVKHAARTIVATLNEGDRLGLVTFSNSSEVVQRLTPMTDQNKQQISRKIDKLRPLDCTNLWHGIKDGLGLFRGEGQSGRVPAVMVLTDGMPNAQCPPQGYVPKIRKMLPLPATIHTFGFGYSLRSGLLKSIAEIGGGNYAFIPDAGMLGTVFVHAVANLQSTFATSATLTLTYPSRLTLEETTGVSVEQEKPTKLSGGRSKLVVKLGNVQYAQSRDVWFRAAAGVVKEAADAVIDVHVSYTRVGRSTPSPASLSASTTLSAPTNLSSAEFTYHQGRSALVSLIASLFPPDAVGEHQAVGESSLEANMTLHLGSLLLQLADPDSRVQSIRRDLKLDNAGTPGQVVLATEKPAFFKRWGQHFLPSLQNAHARQICNSFKDPGPLMYCADSPLFVACRDRLDDAFDNIEAPKPSVHQRFVSGGHSITMSSYNNSMGVCFAGDTSVRLASGRSKPIRALRRCDSVETPLGSRQVVAILRTRVRRTEMARIDGNLLVTPWHPISTNAKTWEFPGRVSTRVRVRYTGSIYSVLLEPDDDPAAHAIRVGGFWGVTLGHGLVGGIGAPASTRADNRTHAFFGSYTKVVRALQQLGVGVGGVIDGGGVKRDQRTGLVCGFRRARLDRPSPAETAVELALLAEGKDFPTQVARRLRGRRVHRVRGHAEGQGTVDVHVHVMDVDEGSEGEE